MVRRPVKKVIKIIGYIPVLWRDEDWDYEHILILLNHKLYRVAKELEVGNFVGCEDEAKEVHKVINGFKSFMEDDFDSARLEAIGKEIEKNMEFIERPDGMFELKFSNIPDKLRAEQKKELARSEKARQAKYNASMNILKERLQKWWN